VDTSASRAKFEYFYRALQVFTRTDLGRMFDHVQSTYGKNLLVLYE
jgi:hypothetical protein